MMEIWRRSKFPKKQFFFIVHILICCWCAFSIEFTSGAVENYVDQYLSTPELCPAVSSILQFSSPFTKEKIRLANFPNNTIILKLTKNQENNSPTAFLNFRCKFQVTAPKGHGVMIIVRSLYLRKDSTDSCRDHIQFKRGGTYKTREICGEVDPSNKEGKPNTLIGPRYLNDDAGVIDVTFSTGKSWSSGRDHDDKPILLELVFTAYSHCSHTQNTIGRCSSRTCIPINLICDGVINCAIDDEFGKDEDGCVEVPEAPSKAMSIFIFGLTAIGTLFVVILIVLVICCCLKRFDMLRSCSNSSRESSTRDQEFSLNPSNSTPPTSPTAPYPQSNSEEWRSVTPNAPKLEDLPPSYKDLFPEPRISSKT